MEVFSLDKKTYFFINAPYVDMDGTYDELLDVLLRHPQTDKAMIERACLNISDFINFNMNNCTSYWSEERKGYYQFPINEETLDENKWKMRILSHKEIVITSEDKDFSQFEYEDLEKMLKMSAFNYRKIEDLTEQEKEQKEKYRVPYGFLFSSLLNGQEF